MYDQTLLQSRTGKQLLHLFDEMEYVMSQLYHNAPLNDSQESKEIENRYMAIYDKISTLRKIRDKIISRRKYHDIF